MALEMSAATRTVLGAALAASLTGGLSAAPQASHVSELLAAARQALGGEQRLSAIKTFKITGSVATPERDDLGRARPTRDYGTFEIDCELPDKFVQIENRAMRQSDASISGGGTSVYHSVTTLGFNGDRVIYAHPLDSYSASPPLPPTSAVLEAQLRRARDGFANLTLGVFAASFAGVPLQFNESAGPDAARAVLVTGQDFRGTLLFNARTHLPQRLERVSYDDYRDVDGQKVPFLITNGRDEWRLKEFLVNVVIPSKVFTPSGKEAR